jgi:hypothetical protein
MKKIGIYTKIRQNWTISVLKKALRVGSKPPRKKTLELTMLLGSY